MSVNMVDMPSKELSVSERRALRRAGQAVQAATESRNRLIRLMHEEGATVRDIADALGTISHQGVWKIVRR